MTSPPLYFRFNRMSKFRSQKILLHQMIHRKISGGVLGGISHLWLHLLGVIIDFDPYVSFLTNISATVNQKSFRPEERIHRFRIEFAEMNIPWPKQVMLPEAELFRYLALRTIVCFILWADPRVIKKYGNSKFIWSAIIALNCIEYIKNIG